MISDFPTLNGMLTCRVFAEIHEKSRNNAADHIVPADVLLTVKWEFYFPHINLITSQMQGASPAIIVMIEASGPKRPPVNNSGPDVTD